MKDGDWIGYGLEEELKNDDLQTDEDLTLRALKKDKTISHYRPENKPGFKLGVNF